MQRLSMIRADLLRQAVAEVAPVGQRFAIGIQRASTRQVVIITPQGELSGVVAGTEPWQIIWPVFQAAKRAGAVEAVNGRQLLAVSDGKVYACTRQELDQLLTGPAIDRTDNGAPVELRAADSTAIVPLKGRTFDPLLLYTPHPIPAGVVFLGIEDQSGVLAVLDGPTNPGSPIVGERVYGYVSELLAEMQQIPGATSLIINVRTMQVYAASSAAMESVVARQAMPIKREAPQLDTFHGAAAFIPSSVHTMAGAGRRLATDGRPIARAVTFSAFLLCVGALIFFGAMLKKLSIDPHVDFIERTPSLSGLAAEQLPELMFGLTISLAVVAAFGPMVVQVIGIIFARAHPWAVYAFWSATAYDMLVNAQHWMLMLTPANGFEALATRYGGVVAGLAQLGAFIGAALLAFLNSVGNEWGLIASVTLIGALWPGFIAAIGMALNQMFVLGPMELMHQGRATVRANQRYLESRAAQYELPDAEPYFVYVDTPGVTVHDTAPQQ